MVEQRYKRLQQIGDVHQLQLLMNNWTEGQADKTISYEVLSGLEAWVELYHQQLSEIAHRQQIRMQDFNNLKIAGGL